MTRKKTSTPNPSTNDGYGSAFSTVSGPAVGVPKDNSAAPAVPAELLAKLLATNEVAAAMPENTAKPSEYGNSPATGDQVQPSTPLATGSSVRETIASPKVGDGIPRLGLNNTIDSLDRARADSSQQPLTTNQGVIIGDNQNSLKIGLRGPTALEDFILREKITHFDHERIPERVVHARGSAAHGYFESYGNLEKITKAAPFKEKGKRTPVFVRFSTVAGERGSADTVRDVRGFAVKFYTEEGNWDLVGNNIPVFFIQDAMKFPDLVHAVKPEPHFAMPQASSAHDTYWDFVSLMPESTHMLMWQMSDRAIPRSYRTMQGFGVHTFRLINADGEAVFCKFHWTPVAGTHSLVWDEAVKISGADPDFHRRDLWEAIEAGAFPEWELGLQVFSEEQAESFDFDILDATKLIPEELVPVLPVGKLVLNRNPDNFFAETEQVAFCTAHIIPGIDFSNDPLLQGRIHSYLDTQISRLGGVNFHEIPINAPITQIHNNQRDGMHRQTIARGRVSYEPNSLGGGCPFQAGIAGFRSFPEPVAADKVRGKPEKFADHYSQARLFWLSQSPAEQRHIAAAFRFELSRVQTPAIRQRVVSLLVNVDEELAKNIAHNLGFEVPAAQPALVDISSKSIQPSPPLSLLTRPGKKGIEGRRIAMLVGEGCDGVIARLIYGILLEEHAVPRFVGARLGRIIVNDGSPLEVDISIEAGPSCLYDAVIIPGDGEQSSLVNNGQALEFLRDQFRHCKPILAVGSAQALLAKAGITPLVQPSEGAKPSERTKANERTKVDETIKAEKNDSAIFCVPNEKVATALEEFKQALARHRDFSREVDPPLV